MRRSSMDSSLTQEIAALLRRTVPELRARYAQAFGEEAPTHHKRWLLKGLAWRLQALAEGDLPERARGRAAELACDADLRLSAPKVPPTVAAEHPRTRGAGFRADRRLPPAGRVPTRPYKSHTRPTPVLPHRPRYQPAVYPPLSAVATPITSSHTNRDLF